mmetsp:Transcript_42150/g.51874  ORF Transcript_42150/g.51874 Transcript_42150/m.51874 type:complete len:348 (+) Transcript_42150:59-1102(+)
MTKLIDVSEGIVGITGPLCLGFVVFLLIAHLLQDYKGTDKTILFLSKFGLFCTIMSITFMIIQHYAPYFGGNTCQCNLIWKISGLFFITSLYAIKYMYVSRVYIYFRGPTNDAYSGNDIPRSVYILTIVMGFSWFTCILLVFFQLKGECFVDINREYGCINTVDLGIIFAAILLLSLDIGLFCWYSRVWHTKIKAIVKHSTHSMQKSNEKLLHAFRIQLVLTYAALITTFIDACIHFGTQEYYINAFFIIDVAMVAVANALGFTKLRRNIYKICWKCQCSGEVHDEYDESSQSKTKSRNNSKTQNTSNSRTSTISIGTHEGNSNNPVPTTNVPSNTGQSSIEIKPTN